MIAVFEMLGVGFGVYLAICLWFAAVQSARLKRLREQMVRFVFDPTRPEDGKLALRALWLEQHAGAEVWVKWYVPFLLPDEYMVGGTYRDEFLAWRKTSPWADLKKAMEYGEDKLPYTKVEGE